MIRGPKFLVRLRSHTVFENTPVKLFCTVEGYPTPQVMCPLCRCGIDDTAQYTAVASNSHGQASSQAAVIVKNAILPEIKYTKINITFLETFDVTFGKEGDCVTLACKMTISPNLANLQPEAQWYRDEHLLKESKWVKMESGGGVAKLTLTHLAKDDEGLYTLRMVTKGGDAVHKAYVFVEDGPPPVPLAPGAPMDIKIHDANRDYVIVSWKPPNTTTEGPIIGYFVDRCEVGMENWMQCNDSPIKICKYPVSGLFEGHSYCFRVRAVNSHGISRPSRMSNPVAALDPTEFGRLQAEGKAPGAPSKVYASETDRTYVVLSWTPPVYHGKAPLWYYIEKSLVGSGSWQRVNTQVPVRSPRYAVFDLAEGKEYLFRVLAANMHGISNPSEPTRPIRTQVLRGVPSAPGQVVSTRETDTSVLIQWAPPKEPNNLIGYYIDSCVKGSKNWTSANHKPLKDTRYMFVVHGLTTGEMYMFRVQAINELGLSDESQESAPLSVRAALKLPSSPYGVALLHCDGESMVLNWKRPLCSGGTPVTDYYIDKYNVAKREWREVNVPPLKERLYKVPKLTLGTVYQFRVYAANFIGLGEPSSPSAPFRCEAWTMPEPGPAYDLSITEIRDDSGVVEWKAPVYNGASAVTGYYVDICKEVTLTMGRPQVKGLETGSSYVFRVRAENASGTGKTSVPSDPVYAKALSGTKEIKCGVDEKTGDVYLCFESCQITEKSQFVWKKSYQEITDFSKGISIKTSGNQSTLSFKNPDKEDVGTFSVSVTNTDGASASYKITAEELEKMMALSYDIRNPIIPLKSELAYKIMERGRVCFWLQAEGISSAVTYKFFANNKELVNSEQTKMRHDVATGIIELVLDHFTEDNEGTFSVQIQDGRAKAQSSLVLIGNGEPPCILCWGSSHPRLRYDVSLPCSVANLKKESAFHWFKDDVEVIPDVPADLSSGVCRLPLPLVRADSRCLCSLPRKHRHKRLCCYRISCFNRDSKISSSERMRVGGTPAMASLEIVEPTERDKGVYTFQITDAEKTYTPPPLRLLGSFIDIIISFGVTPCAMISFFPDRGKVLGGLPDVVSIMEKKTLSLTCTVCGDPKPQVTWFKNDQEVEPGDQYVILLDSGKFASVTIKGVTLEDSGKFTMCVQNKYGGESVDIIVSVFKHGDKIPDIKPMAAPKRILPPTHPIVIPISSSPAPAPSKSSAPPQSTKSPSSSRFGARRK
uniref:Myomesin 2a n=1 Tax=Electrophorus electricus TaxID=8005 RepID=A0A4W4F3I2_ELEEL